MMGNFLEYKMGNKVMFDQGKLLYLSRFLQVILLKYNLAIT